MKKKKDNKTEAAFLSFLWVIIYDTLSQFIWLWCPHVLFVRIQSNRGTKVIPEVPHGKHRMICG